MKMATHCVICYETSVIGKDISRTLKFLALKRGIKSLLDKGRIVISATYAEGFYPIEDLHIGKYAFEAVYVGREAIRQKGLRHNFRKEGRDPGRHHAHGCGLL